MGMQAHLGKEHRADLDKEQAYLGKQAHLGKQAELDRQADLDK